MSGQRLGQPAHAAAEIQRTAPGGGQAPVRQAGHHGVNLGLAAGEKHLRIPAVALRLGKAEHRVERVLGAKGVIGFLNVFQGHDGSAVRLSLSVRGKYRSLAKRRGQLSAFRVRGYYLPMFELNVIGVFALLATAMCWSLAVLLYRTGAPDSVARKLSLLLVVEGITLISSGYIDLFFTAELKALTWYPAWFQAEFVVHTIGDCAMLALYPPFLAAALDTPLARPFGSRNARIALAVAATALAVLTLTTP